MFSISPIWTGKVWSIIRLKAAKLGNRSNTGTFTSAAISGTEISKRVNLLENAIVA